MSICFTARGAALTVASSGVGCRCIATTIGIKYRKHFVNKKMCIGMGYIRLGTGQVAVYVVERKKEKEMLLDLQCIGLKREPS